MGKQQHQKKFRYPDGIIKVGDNFIVYSQKIDAITRRKKAIYFTPELEKAIAYKNKFWKGVKKRGNSD